MENEMQYNTINEVLAAWNPLGVPDDIAQSEYTSYVPRVQSSLSSEQTLIDCLADIVNNKMGLELDLNNEEDLNELKAVYQQLIKITHA